MTPFAPTPARAAAARATVHPVGSEAIIMGKLIRLTVLASVAALVVRSLPDIKRYLKIRSM
jgi:hypothetical protein